MSLKQTKQGAVYIIFMHLFFLTIDLLGKKLLMASSFMIPMEVLIYLFTLCFN
jgi:hypothetical protein